MQMLSSDKLPVCLECSMIFESQVEFHGHLRCPRVDRETSNDKLIKILLDNPEKTAQEIIIMIVKEAKL